MIDFAEKKAIDSLCLRPVLLQPQRDSAILEAHHSLHIGNATTACISHEQLRRDSRFVQRAIISLPEGSLRTSDRLQAFSKRFNQLILNFLEGRSGPAFAKHKANYALSKATASCRI
jgi:hypothetical protein